MFQQILDQTIAGGGIAIGLLALRAPRDDAWMLQGTGFSVIGWLDIALRAVSYPAGVSRISLPLAPPTRKCGTS